MSITAVAQALRDPERFATEHHAAPNPRDLVALMATASAGVGIYGACMHAFQGGPSMLQNAGAALLAAGIAWTATLPSLYVVGSVTGSTLPLRGLILSTLITVSFGGLAMLASIPVLWFFELCLPHPAMRLGANALIFAGVGLSMGDVFIRVMRTLEGFRFLHLAWLGLLSVVGAELFAVFGLFRLGA